MNLKEKIAVLQQIVKYIDVNETEARFLVGLMLSDFERDRKWNGIIIIGSIGALVGLMFGLIVRLAR